MNKEDKKELIEISIVALTLMVIPSIVLFKVHPDTFFEVFYALVTALLIIMFVAGIMMICFVIKKLLNSDDQ